MKERYLKDWGGGGGGGEWLRHIVFRLIVKILRFFLSILKMWGEYICTWGLDYNSNFPSTMGRDAISPSEVKCQL